jgi:hypothetical protein
LACAISASLLDTIAAPCKFIHSRCCGSTGVTGEDAAFVVSLGDIPGVLAATVALKLPVTNAHG